MRTLYNYGLTPIRIKRRHLHTYSTYHRGTELLMGAFNWLDLAPKCRNENGIISWVKLHDEY